MSTITITCKKSASSLSETTEHPPSPKTVVPESNVAVTGRPKVSYLQEDNRLSIHSPNITIIIFVNIFFCTFLILRNLTLRFDRSFKDFSSIYMSKFFKVWTDSLRIHFEGTDVKFSKVLTEILMSVFGGISVTRTVAESYLLNTLNVKCDKEH